jgi:hypothetical protein
LEFEVRVLGDLKVSHQEAIPYTVILTDSRDVCNGIYVRFEEVVLSMGHGPDGAVQLRTLDNRWIGDLHRSEGARNSYQAFHAEWMTFIEQIRLQDVESAVAGLTLARSSVAMIEECYALIAKKANTFIAADSAPVL